MEETMHVNELMSKKVELVSPSASLWDAARKMRDLDIGCLPVGENDRVVGIITDRHITCRWVADGEAPGKATVNDAMSKSVSYCFDDQDVSDAIHLMAEKHIRRLPVLSRQKRLVGMLSLGDISQHTSAKTSAELLKGVTTPKHNVVRRPI